MMSAYKSKPRRIVVLGTGGTIAGQGTAAGTNLCSTAGTVPVSQLIAGIDAPVGYELHGEQVAQLDSKDMDLPTWLRLRERCLYWLAEADVVGVVITHGTDTVEETAFFLESTVDCSKPVVMTCAMRPASASSPDGPQNIRDALAVVTDPAATGVMVVCAGEIHGARHVTKTHPYRLNAFSSGDMGPVGYVEEGTVRLVRSWSLQRPGIPQVALGAWDDPAVWPRVQILASHAGAGGDVLNLLVEHRSTRQFGAIDGVVLAATGNGSLHRDLEQAALRAQSTGVAILIASRCASGMVMRPADPPIPDAGDLNPAKARIQLMLSLLAASAIAEK